MRSAWFGFQRCRLSSERRGPRPAPPGSLAGAFLGIRVPRLLHELGVTDITCLNCDPTGDFAHNPEPLRENLTEISDYIASHKVDVGFVVDPDVDRLAIVCEDGEMFGEEYTLVSVADYILSHTQGNTVSNLSSTRALADITAHYGGQYAAAAVGEVNMGLQDVAGMVASNGNVHSPTPPSIS